MEIAGQVGEPTLVEEVVGLDVLTDVVGLEDVVVGLVVPAKQEHALESFEADDEQADANVGIEEAGATVYVWQKEEALLIFFEKALRQSSALQLDEIATPIKRVLKSANRRKL